MRLELSLPDPLVNGAQRAAAASGVSLEAYLAEALELRMRNEALRLTPEQVAVVRSAQDDVKAGRVLTTDQARADLEAHRKEWRAAHRS